MREKLNISQENDAIREDISQTRRRMDDNLDRLTDRFRPRHLLNDLLEFWHARRREKEEGESRLPEAIQENARRAGRAVASQLRDNPMPSLLLGAGIAWFIIERSRAGRPYPSYYSSGEIEPMEDIEGDYSATYHTGMEYGDPGLGAPENEPQPGGPYATASHGSGGIRRKARKFAGEARRKLREGEQQLREQGQHLRERAGQSGQRIRERAAAITHEVQDRVRTGYQNTQETIMERYRQAEEKVVQGYHHAQERVRESYHHAQETLRETAEAHPLATGAACLGIGLLAGFLLPRSTREDQWLGETADTVKDKVRDASQDLISRGKHVAQAASQAAQSEAERQGLTPEHLKESIKAVGQETRKAAQESAEAEGLSTKTNKSQGQHRSGFTQSGASTKSPVPGASI